MKTGYKVCDAMTKKPVFVSSGTAIEECANLMEKNHVGSLIIKENGNLAGIITEQDIVRKIVAKGINPLSKKVGEYMVKEVVTIDPGNDIYDALVMMRDKNIRHIPVTDKKQLVGLLTLKDILKIQPQLFELLVDKFELREEQTKPIHVIGEKEGICEVCGDYSPSLHNVDGSMLCEKCADQEKS